MILVQPQSIRLTADGLQSPRVTLETFADRCLLRLRRPTTAAPLDWPETSIVEATIIISVDGLLHTATASFKGGIRLNGAREVPECRLSYGLPYSLVEDADHRPVTVDGKDYVRGTRLGERSRHAYLGSISLRLVSGPPAELELLQAETTASLGPFILVHHSVTFDTASDLSAVADVDGVLSWTHSAGGTSRAAFAGGGNSDGGGGVAGSMTYNGTAMTEHWDLTQTNFSGQGYSLANNSVPSGNATVQYSAGGGSQNEMVASVMTLNGVHQGTPVGTPQSTQGTGTTASVTVGSVNATDLVVDYIWGADALTIGADQQERISETVSSLFLKGSTQPGTAGGVMSWTSVNADGWTYGAIAFKQVATTVALTGTVTSSITETDIVNGGKTIILTVTDDTYVPDAIVTPVIQSGDCTVSGNNTAEDPWAVSYPNASTGDLLIFYVAWDDSTATTDVAEPAGPNSEVLTELNATPITDASTETRAKAWYTVATGTWTASTLSFNPSATESWSATVVRIPAGEFEAATPIGAVGTSAATGTADTNVVSPAFSAGASDGDGALLWFASVDADPLSATPPTGWTILQRQDLGAVAHGVAIRNTEVTDSESIASANWAIAGDSWTSIAVVVRAPTTTPWVDARAAFAAGIDSGQSEGTGWDARRSTILPVTAVARTSDTVATWTLVADGSYNITAQETITATVPASVLAGGAAVVASPTFTIDTDGGAPPAIPHHLLMLGIGR